ncbi:two-component system response regulator MtrA [Archangium gephyra]|uniref:DNA-binding response regulator n=1 Tax=Archangium gephyra TaxID=48 RepID=A0AAC8TGV6_9BACT|nr:response regulator transcription factor [Archangium gephyra]AKJ03946.1 DNA-binding response regulator [Archangium gephyra]REG23721.1 two-component system response regulator MtrA [Archangium gephyra]
MGERILLIEDDPQLGAQIADFLGRAGFEPTWWTGGRPLQPGESSAYGLIILDLMLPGTYGLDILRQLREGSDVPVLILSARNDTADKVRALKLGADDYMTKPFWPEELVERVRARLRRPVMQRQSLLELGTLQVDLQAREVRVEGKPVELTRVEFDLLAALAKRPGAAVTRQWLVENVLDPEREGSERTLDVHVSRLRRKLGPGKHVETVWGIGYRLGEGGGT